MTRSLAELDWPFATARLTIRPTTAADVDAIWAWRRDPSVGEWISARDLTRATYEQQLSCQLANALVAFAGDRLVATGKVDVHSPWAQDEVAAVARNTVAEVGWLLDPACQGQGLGTELGRALLQIAFDGCGVRRVVASCAADNVASWRLMERIGMRREAHAVKDWLHRDKGWLDGFSYAILADEWHRLGPEALAAT